MEESEQFFCYIDFTTMVFQYEMVNCTKTIILHIRIVGDTDFDNMSAIHYHHQQPTAQQRE